MNKNVAIVLLLILLAMQGIVVYIVASVNPTTIEGQRIAGLTLGIDMFLFAGFIILYHRNFSNPVYSEPEEGSESEE